MAILLVGSTGNGKSTLGNFLIDPRDEVLFEKQYFKTAQANLPETQNVLPVAFIEKSRLTTVIDTPGLNESATHDLKHMIQIVDCLQSVEKILACVFVVKFNTKIDAQYKSTLQYYRKLLPSIFERNVIIVMTDYATDSRSVNLRKRQHINVDEIKKNTLREMVESGSLSYEPSLFTIDCLPCSEDERKINLEERDAILSKITSQNPFKSSDVRVAKTPFLKSQDDAKIKAYEGEITGYNKRLQEANKEAKVALGKVQTQQQKITEKKKVIKQISDRLSEIDSSDLTEIASWSVNRSWKLLQFLNESFDIKPPCEFESVVKWTNGHSEWKDYEEGEHRVKGRVEGNFMRGIYANISVQTSKRKKYKSEVDKLKANEVFAETEMVGLKREMDVIKNNYDYFKNVIGLLQDFITEILKTIETLDNDYLTLDEAKAHLAQMYQ